MIKCLIKKEKQSNVIILISLITQTLELGIQTPLQSTKIARTEKTYLSIKIDRYKNFKNNKERLLQRLPTSISSFSYVMSFISIIS